MASSDFFLARKSRSEALLHKLVARLTGIKPSSLAFDPLYEQALEGIRNHSFYEPLPSRVREGIAGLSFKLRVHRHYARAERLEELSAALPEALQSPATPDLPYAVLSLLQLLSEAPATVLEEPPLLPTRAAADAALRESLLLDFSRVGPFSAEAWEEEVGRRAGRGRRTAPTPPSTSPASPARRQPNPPAHGGGGGARGAAAALQEVPADWSALDVLAYPRLEQGLLRAWGEGPFEARRPASLAAGLAASRAARLSFDAAGPDARPLSSSPRPRVPRARRPPRAPLRAGRRHGRFEGRAVEGAPARFALLHASPGALHAALADFLAAGALAARLDTFARRASLPDFSHGLTTQALAAAVGRYLRAHRRAVAAVERSTLRWLQRAPPPSAAEPGRTLLALQRSLLPLARRLQSLAAILSRALLPPDVFSPDWLPAVEAEAAAAAAAAAAAKRSPLRAWAPEAAPPGPPGPGASASAAERTRRLLTVLWEAMGELALLGDGALQGAVQELWVAALRPALRFLEAWLYRGDPADPFAEFPVQAREEQRATPLEYWAAAFRIRTYRPTAPEGAAGAAPAAEGPEGEVEAVPGFLAPVAREALLAGKSLALLISLREPALAAARQARLREAMGPLWGAPAAPHAPSSSDEADEEGPDDEEEEDEAPSPLPPRAAAAAAARRRTLRPPARGSRRAPPPLHSPKTPDGSWRGGEAAEGAGRALSTSASAGRWWRCGRRRRRRPAAQGGGDDWGAGLLPGPAGAGPPPPALPPSEVPAALAFAGSSRIAEEALPPPPSSPLPPPSPAASPRPGPGSLAAALSSVGAPSPRRPRRRPRRCTAGRGPAAGPAWLPLEAALSRSLLAPMREQCRRASRALARLFMRDLRLAEHLAALRAYFFGAAGDVMHHFAAALFEKLDAGEPWQDLHRLNGALHDAPAPPRLAPFSPLFSVHIALPDPAAPPPSAAPLAASASFPPLPPLGGLPPEAALRDRSLAALDSLRLAYEAPGPLAILISPSALDLYNRVMLLLLQIRRAKHALDRAAAARRGALGKAHLHRYQLLHHELQHFVTNLYTFVVQGVGERAFRECLARMRRARDLDELCAAHQAYLVGVRDRCLLTPKAEVVLESIRKQLAAVLRFRDEFERWAAMEPGAATEAPVGRNVAAALEGVARDFRKINRFLLLVLDRIVRHGSHPHLEELLLRLNFNGFYPGAGGGPGPASAG
eukprot:tig00000984_g5982.t1